MMHPDNLRFLFTFIHFSGVKSTSRVNKPLIESTSNNICNKNNNRTRTCQLNIFVTQTCNLDFLAKLQSNQLTDMGPSEKTRFAYLKKCQKVMRTQHVHRKKGMRVCPFSSECVSPTLPYFFCLQMICMAKPLLAPPLPLTLPPPPRCHLCRCHHQTRFFP